MSTIPSNPKRTPPIGLPNATETPAAAAAANNLRFCATGKKDKKVLKNMRSLYLRCVETL